MARSKREEIPYQKTRNFVREWREYRGMSLRTLAKLTGYSHASLSRKENGLEGWNDENLALVAQALHTDVMSLLSRRPEQTEGIWSVWLTLSDEDKRQLLELARGFGDLTDTERRQLIEIAAGLKRARTD